eukprot:CAMPEP_0172308442 /NCGR_PEP_ID=MMETSP1058-20130122/9029_1 /TAXON_ID=83371 /ORGANISM="Detonula confervacea, Strain CCMP 353" /LENGTH=728 /DNA_ID=CAMNT_0013020859 /DNA_START=23 /DNA_END=2209 /DNA_ORIENTATION=-
MAAEVTSSTNPPTSSSTYEADERIAARHAVTLADEKWRTLCTQHASTFVAAERRSVSIQKALQELLIEIEQETKPSVKRVGRALDPNYSTSSAEGNDDEGGEGEEDGDGPIQPASALLADLAEKHRLRRRTLMQHSSLLELLELPSLMDACVRSSLYEDALSIAGFANTLERRHLLENSSGSGQQQQSDTKDGKKQTNEDPQHNKKGDVVAGVVSEIRRREADLRRMLIHRLRQDVTMPQCLEVVTALRRLNGVELERRNNSKSTISIGTAAAADHDLEGVHAAMEMRLQVDFLEARDAWLEGGVTKIGSAQAVAVAASSDKGSSSTSAQAEQILDGIERYRTRCFEIVTQFLAIFRGSFAPSTASSSSNNHHDHSFSLLSMWTARRIQTFLTTLSSNIVTHVNDTATLRDALDSASFFASSMGRVGADFQPLLAPIFEPRLTEMIVGHWTDGLNGMMETLKACRDAGVAGPLFGTETSSSKDGNGGSGYVDDGVEIIQSSRTPAPPRKLLALPPLARFLNAYLGGLNELRRCLLPGAFPAIRSAQGKLVADAKMALQANERSVLTPGLRGEAVRLREVASKMKSEFNNSLEPYMIGCLEVALGSVDYAMEEAKAAALTAEKARIAAEKVKAEKEAIEKAKTEAEALEKAEEEALEKAETEALEKAETEALEKAETEALKKETAERIENDAVSQGADQNEDSAVDNSTEPTQTETDLFDDGDDMYGSD